MIIQTGMRTDIPAFYSKWFANRLTEGYVLVRNPYNPEAVTEYSLSPDVVDIIAFCTKNPSPMFPYMNLLKAYSQYWFVTITPYGKEIEPGAPPKENVIEDFKRLSDIVGKECTAWRYDPIFITKDYTAERHIYDFEVMAEKLSGHTHTCVISFIDIYMKVKRNFPEAGTVQKADRLRIGREFARIGRKYGMNVKACGEGTELESYGIDCSGCMTLEVFETAARGRLDAPAKKPPRTECSCFMGNDIGAYNTCGHLCRYCYANYNEATVRRNMKKHDPDSPFLIGNLKPGDRIHKAKQESWLNLQLTLNI